MKYFSVIVSIVLGILAGNVAIAHRNFVSVMEDKTPLYALSGKVDVSPALQVSRYYPLEVLAIGKNKWLSVRDMKGYSWWVEDKYVSDLRTVVALQVTDVLETADMAAKVVFRVDELVALWLLDDQARDGFLHVRHMDGLVGYVYANNMWGF